MLTKIAKTSPHDGRGPKETDWGGEERKTINGQLYITKWPLGYWIGPVCDELAFFLDGVLQDAMDGACESYAYVD